MPRDEATSQVPKFFPNLKKCAQMREIKKLLSIPSTSFKHSFHLPPPWEREQKPSEGEKKSSSCILFLRLDFRTTTGLKMSTYSFFIVTVWRRHKTRTDLRLILIYFFLFVPASPSFFPLLFQSGSRYEFPSGIHERKLVSYYASWLGRD